MFHTYLHSPVGELLIVGDEVGLHAIHFPKNGQRRDPDVAWRADPAPFRDVIHQLEEYFAGERASFQLRLVPQGTPFQRKVWNELRRIPYAHTISYGELARRIGKPSASRAVGAANGRNPLPIVVPCHRVIGKDGTLTGFGGGLTAKATLLEIERRSLATAGRGD